MKEIRHFVMRKYSGATARKTLWEQLSRGFLRYVDAEQWLDFITTSERPKEPKKNFTIHTSVVDYDKAGDPLGELRMKISDFLVDATESQLTKIHESVKQDVVGMSDSYMPTDDPRYDGTGYLVEADTYASHSLWKEHHLEYEWKQEGGGYGVTVGHVAGNAVVISVLWNVVNGMRMLFWHPTSSTVDYTMIGEWFDKYCNPMQLGRDGKKARCYAEDFSEAIRGSNRKKMVDECPRF